MIEERQERGRIEERIENAREGKYGRVRVIEIKAFKQDAILEGRETLKWLTALLVQHYEGFHPDHVALNRQPTNQRRVKLGFTNCETTPEQRVGCIEKITRQMLSDVQSAPARLRSVRLTRNRHRPLVASLLLGLQRTNHPKRKSQSQEIETLGGERTTNLGDLFNDHSNSDSDSKRRSDRITIFGRIVDRRAVESESEKYGRRGSSSSTLHDENLGNGRETKERREGGKRGGNATDRNNKGGNPRWSNNAKSVFPPVIFRASSEILPRDRTREPGRRRGFLCAGDSLTSLVIECDQSTDASLLALRQTEAAQHRQPPPVLESCFFLVVETEGVTEVGGEKWAKQVKEEPPYAIYRLTFDLTPICKGTLEPCPREACAIEVKQHELGDINILKESIQCMYLYPQSKQDDPLQVQESNHDQDHIIENLDKQIINNQSVELDHEIQKNGDHVDRPFIAMRASSPNYCPGCPYELNPNLPGFTAFGEQVVKSMDELIQNDFKHKVINIANVTRAVPPSSNIIQYQILFYIGETNCLKNAVEQQKCFVQVNLPVKICLVTFEEQPWQQSSRKIIKNNCTMDDNAEIKENVNFYSTLNSEALVTSVPNREEANYEKWEALENLRNILDNYTYVTTKDSEKLEQSVVTEHPILKVSINKSDNNDKPQEFEDKVKEFNEFLKDFDVPTTETRSNLEINKDEVKEEIIYPTKLKEGTEIKECLFEIWSQPWIDNGSPKITIHCDVNNRRKRSLQGKLYNYKMLKIAQEMKDQSLFANFVKTFNKTYASAEEKQQRFKVFKMNLQIIQMLQTYEQGTAQYGVTMFADLTPKEFKARYLGLRPELKRENEIPFSEAEIPDISLPHKFDWRDYGVVTPVKDQGRCGSCWAFSVTGNIEGQYAIKHGNLLSLSEQELVDCDTLDEGCNGGYMDNAYKAIETIGGLELESDYPYDGKNEKCHFVKTKATVQVIDAVNITSNETKMAQWLTQKGPISIAINAIAMQFYFGGVSHPIHALCNANALDHGVLIVGYGTSRYPIFHKELPYWIIKNSWGPRWGESGYYRVYRGDGTCGLNKQPTSAIVA
ncbi:hypothetical protein WN48_07777 [Eufriesea mexicana]|uniref:Cysteine proteinase CG12163 n=1 Tax=Eufriesea mexicana TaxID=516756 RepID=A0A310SH02_9HYME|nr:hypothetical protein WN48_07777 [Eufriesea mexicana]